MVFHIQRRLSGSIFRKKVAAWGPLMRGFWKNFGMIIVDNFFKARKRFTIHDHNRKCLKILNTISAHSKKRLPKIRDIQNNISLVTQADTWGRTNGTCPTPLFHSLWSCFFQFSSRVSGRPTYTVMFPLIPNFYALVLTCSLRYPEPEFVNIYGAQESIPLQGIDSVGVCSLAGRYDNRISTRFLAPIDFFKITAQRKINLRKQREWCTICRIRYLKNQSEIFYNDDILFQLF